MSQSGIFVRFCGICFLGASALPTSAQIPNVVTGDSLTPWQVIASSPPNQSIHISIGGHASFPQPAVPAKIIKLIAPLILDGVTLPVDTPLALTLTTKTNAKAWCVLPQNADSSVSKTFPLMWGGSIFSKGFRTQWGNSTRCLADADGDGLFETQLDGKFDSLGLPSIRRLSRPLKIAVPASATESDPSNVIGYSIAATVIYTDFSRRRSSPCISMMPDAIKAANPEIGKRFSGVTLLRNDGTACFDALDETLRPQAAGQLAAVAGASLMNRGAMLLVEKIDHDGVDIRLIQLFNSYIIATRTEKAEVDY